MEYPWCPGFDDEFRNAIEDNVLRPELLEKLVADSRKHAVQYYEELGGVLPQVNDIAQKQYDAWCELCKALAETPSEYFPGRNCVPMEVAEKAEHITTFAKGSWVDACKTPNGVQELINGHEGRVAQWQLDYDAKYSPEKAVAKRQKEENTRKVVERTFDQNVEMKDGEALVYVPAPSAAAAYTALRNIITLRDTVPLEGGRPFPPMEQMVSEPQGEENTSLYDGKMIIRNRPKECVITLSAEMVKRLEAVDAGKAPFVHPEIVESSHGDERAAHYRSIAQQNAALADDMERLRSLKGRWTETVNATAQLNREL